MTTPTLLLLLMLAPWVHVMAQSFTELAVPRFMGCKSSGTLNNNRTPFGACLRIDGLVPNTAYDIRGGVGLVSDAPTSFGAGNVWSGTSFAGNVVINAFTTDGSGSSGPFWVFFQPTANSSRFDAGQVHNLRIGYAVSGNSISSVPAYVGAKTITSLDIAVNPRTPSATDDGAFISGNALPAAGGNYVMLFDNISGTGDPLFIYQVRPAFPVQTLSQQDLPPVINDIYMQSGSSIVGDYPAVIPAGTNNPDGIRRIEARSSDFSLVACNTDADGIWPSGGNTTNAGRREVIMITNSDAPLVPGGPSLPDVRTDTLVVNITHSSGTSGGEVLDDGNAAITERGLCWSLTPDPTTADSHSPEPGSMGAFSSIMSGLSPLTTYHYRAYATNAIGTAYGSTHQFTTLCEPVPPAPDFFSDRTEILVGDSVLFFDSTAYCPETWNWSFVCGEPMTSVLKNPAPVTYNYPGEFNVCLTASNEYGIQTKCREACIKVVEPYHPRIVITEISYNPPESGTDSLEFIELYNNDTVPVNLLDFSFGAGVVFVFPDILLQPGQFLVVGVNDTALLNMFGVPACEWTSGSLNNSGELILLLDNFNVTIDSVFYGDNNPWSPLADGQGHSLELCDPDSDNALGTSWRASLTYQGINTDLDSVWASPGSGCLETPIAGFVASDTMIIAGGTVVFTNISSGLINGYLWTFEGGAPETFFGEIPPPVQYVNPGTYDVTLIAYNNAGQDTAFRGDYIEAGPSGIACKTHDMPVLYPNPAYNGFSTIRFCESGKHEVTLLDETGCEVLHVQTDRQSILLDLAHYPAGLYFVRVADSRRTSACHLKLIIK